MDEAVKMTTSSLRRQYLDLLQRKAFTLSLQYVILDTENQQI